MSPGEVNQRTFRSETYNSNLSLYLIGIVQNQEIWASKIQYLNDSTEFRHAYYILENRLAREFKSLDEKFKRGLKHKADTAKNLNIFATSFSEKRDLLSQWRAYCPDAGGYNIGFNYSDLKWALGKYDLNIVPCVYEEEKQNALIDDLIKHFSSRYRNQKISDWEDFLNDFYSEFIRLAPILKHLSFKEEREWRIVSGPIRYSRENVDFRPGKSMIIPYFKIQLTNSDKNFSFHRINIGPTPHKKLAEDSIIGLLFKSGHFDELADHSKILRSQIPYRAW